MKLPYADGSGKTATVWFKGWDGYPWYVPAKNEGPNGWSEGNARVHPSHKKKRAVRNPVEGYDGDEYRKNRDAEQKDEFFSLDTPE